jgi:outer membrane lipoprotein SlyB
MKLARFLAVTCLFTIVPACATSYTTSATWGEVAPDGYRYGRVAWVREYVEHLHGDPAGGAIAGAIIGGILGGGHGPGALVGAVGGAAIGAAASDGHSESRYYDVAVRFDDGSQQVFRFPNGAPFRPGDNVVQTSQGLRPV